MDARYWSNEELVDETLKRLRESGHFSNEIPADIASMPFAERERLTFNLGNYTLYSLRWVRLLSAKDELRHLWSQ
jgi:hypothetical protein